MLLWTGRVAQIQPGHQSRAAFCKVTTMLMGMDCTSAEFKTRALRKSVRIDPPGGSIYCSWNFDSLAIPD